MILYVDAVVREIICARRGRESSHVGDWAQVGMRRAGRSAWRRRVHTREVARNLALLGAVHDAAERDHVVPVMVEVL